MSDPAITPAVCYRDPRAAVAWLPEEVGAAGLDAHCERARSAGAEITDEPADEFVGDRRYRAVDPEGHHWTFAVHVRDVGQAEAEEFLGHRIERWS